MALHHRLHALRQRPHHERRAIAALVAYGVVAVLAIVWAIVFFTDINAAAQQTQQTQTTATTTLQ